MKFHFPLTLLVLILVNGACATKELKSVDDYIESTNNGTDYFMEDGSGLPILTSSLSKSPTISGSKLKPLKASPSTFPSKASTSPTIASKTVGPTLKPTSSLPTTKPTQIGTFSLFLVNDSISTRTNDQNLPPTTAPTDVTLATRRKPSSIPTVSPTLAFPIKTRSAGPTTKSRSMPPSCKPTSLNPTATPSITPTVSPTDFKRGVINDVRYHNNFTVMVGPVNVYNIFYGNFQKQNGTKTMDLINHFTANIGNTSWYNMLTNFYQIDKGVKTFVSRSSMKLRGVFQDTRTNVLTEMGIAELLVAKFNYEGLPADPNAIYTVIFRGDIPMMNGGRSWLYDWCAYHGVFRLNNGYVIKFIVVGDSALSQGGYLCQPIPNKASPNNNIGADNMVSVLAHSIAGTITNSMKFVGNQPTRLGAWHFDPSGMEIGDNCKFHFGAYSGNYNLIVNQKRFFVQSLWLPGRGCSMK